MSSLQFHVEFVKLAASYIVITLAIPTCQSFWNKMFLYLFVFFCDMFGMY